MCLSKPQKVLKVNGDRVSVEFFNKKKTVKSAIHLKPGDYVICQRNFVAQKISKKSAEEMLKEWREMNKLV